MRIKNEQSLTDEFISIHELRKRNKLKSNFLRDQVSHEQFSFQPQISFDFTSQWEKLKSYLVDITDSIMYESVEEFDDLPGTGSENRNLMLAMDSGSGIQYKSISVGSVQAHSSLSRIINSALSKLEQFLRNIQIGLVLDAETLEFNQDSCESHCKAHASQKKEIRLVEVFKKDALVSKIKKLLKKGADIFQEIILIFSAEDQPTNQYEPNHSIENRNDYDDFGNDP